MLACALDLPLCVLYDLNSVDSCLIHLKPPICVRVIYTKLSKLRASLEKRSLTWRVEVFSKTPFIDEDCEENKGLNEGTYRPQNKMTVLLWRLKKPGAPPSRHHIIKESLL